MTDVQKELQKLKTLINQRPATAIFSNKSNESDKIAHGDAEFFINDMSKKFVFTRSRVKNPVMIDAETKSLENLEYINGTKVEEITEQVEAIMELKETVSKHDGRITVLEDNYTKTDERLTNCENKNTEQDSRLTNCESKNTEQDQRITVLEQTSMCSDSEKIIADFRIGAKQIISRESEWGAGYGLLNIGFYTDGLYDDDLNGKGLWIQTAYTLADDNTFENAGPYKYEAKFKVPRTMNTGEIIEVAKNVYFARASKNCYKFEWHYVPFSGTEYLAIITEASVYGYIEGHTHDNLHLLKNLTVDGEISAGNLHFYGNITCENNATFKMVHTNADAYGPVADIGFLRICNSKKSDNEAENWVYIRHTSNNGKDLMRFKTDVVDSCVNFKSISFETNNYIKFTNDTVSNDYAYIQLKGTASNAGELEIATCDDATEPIYVRQYTGNRATLKRTLTLLDGSGNTSIPGALSIKGAGSIGGDCSIGGELSTGGVITCRWVVLRDELGNENKKLYVFANSGKLYVKNPAISKQKELWGGSQTITHITNIVGNFEIGTFCEANGNIYDGYEKINNTDCICAVKQATLLNKKIVGIISSEDEFASHGDVLVKIAPETICEVGDILCPDERGYGRVASEDELIFMMMYAIPRPKITCLETGIEGFVACFIV